MTSNKYDFSMLPISGVLKTACSIFPFITAGMITGMLFFWLFPCYETGNNISFKEISRKRHVGKLIKKS
jgi:hypothetical protein